MTYPPRLAGTIRIFFALILDIVTVIVLNALLIGVFGLFYPVDEEYLAIPMLITIILGLLYFLAVPRTRFGTIGQWFLCIRTIYDIEWLRPIMKDEYQELLERKGKRISVIREKSWIPPLIRCGLVVVYILLGFSLAIFAVGNATRHTIVVQAARAHIEADPKIKEQLAEARYLGSIPRLVVVEKHQAMVVFKVTLENGEAAIWSRLQRPDEESAWQIVASELREVVPKHRYSFSDSILTYSIHR